MSFQHASVNLLILLYKNHYILYFYLYHIKVTKYFTSFFKNLYLEFLSQFRADFVVEPVCHVVHQKFSNVSVY